MLKKLPMRLKGYRLSIHDDYCIVVLIDEDRESCLELKKQLETAAREAGLYTKSNPQQNGKFRVVNRIVIEELESWFFGDTVALHKAYPKVPESLQYRKKYRAPDAITGGTYEALERLLIRNRYYTGKLPKTEVARNIAQYMEPSRNRSKSFQVFVEGINACIAQNS